MGKTYNEDIEKDYASGLSQRLLSKKEFNELISELKAGNEKARETIIECNLRLAYSIARKYRGRGVDIMDLVQEANIGLIKSINKYAPSKGYAFSTYATWWITAAVRRYIQDNGTAIKVPSYMNEKISKIESAMRKLEVDGDVSDSEISEFMEISEEELKFAMESKRKTDVLSLDYENGNEDTLMDTLESESSIDNEILDHERRDILIQAAKAVCKTERDAEILLKSFGLFGKITLEDIGVSYGISKERVRQIRDAGLTKLQGVVNSTTSEYKKVRESLKLYNE